MLSKKYHILLLLLSFLFCINNSSQAKSPNEYEFPIDSLEEVITQSGVAIDKNISSDGNGSLFINPSQPQTIELIEIDKDSFKNKRLTYTAKMKSENLEAKGDMRGISYIEMVATFSDGEEIISRGPRVPIKGTTDWRPVDTVIYIDKGNSPENVKLNLVVEGEGKVWIDDIKLDVIPLRLNYLFWGHIVVWLVLIIYIYELIRKQKQLKRQLDAIS